MTHRGLFLAAAAGGALCWLLLAHPVLLLAAVAVLFVWLLVRRAHDAVTHRRPADRCREMAR